MIAFLKKMNDDSALETSFHIFSSNVAGRKTVSNFSFSDTPKKF